jgi:hypothetical protein
MTFVALLFCNLAQAFYDVSACHLEIQDKNIPPHAGTYRSASSYLYHCAASRFVCLKMLENSAVVKKVTENRADRLHH